MDKAIQELNWLSERFSGIIALKDELAEFSGKKNQKAELDKAIEETRKELEKLQTKVKDCKASIAAAEKAIEDKTLEAENKALEVENKAKAKAQEHIRLASEEAKELMEKTKAKAAEMGIEVQKNMNLAKKFENEANEAEARLKRVQHELEKLRNEI